MANVILWICAAIATAVFVVMLYSVATFRGGPALRAGGRGRSTLVEVIWALIPIAIVIVAMMPVITTLTRST